MKDPRMSLPPEQIMAIGESSLSQCTSMFLDVVFNKLSVGEVQLLSDLAMMKDDEGLSQLLRSMSEQDHWCRIVQLLCLIGVKAATLERAKSDKSIFETEENKGTS